MCLVCVYALRCRFAWRLEMYNCKKKQIYFGVKIMFREPNFYYFYCLRSAFGSVKNDNRHACFKLHRSTCYGVILNIVQADFK